MDDMSIDTSLEERREIEDSILHSHTVCVNSVEITNKKKKSDGCVINMKPEKERRGIKAIYNCTHIVTTTTL